MATPANLFLPPDIQLSQINLQRQQALADQLRQQSIEQTPSEVVSGRVVPRGIGYGLTQLAKGLLAGKTQQQVNEGTANMAKMYADYLTKSASSMFPGSQTPMGTTDSGQSVPTYTPPGTSTPVGDTGSQSVPVTPQQTGPQLPPGMRDAYISALRMGNQEAANEILKTAWSSQMPTEFQRDLQVVSPDMRQAAIANKFTPPIVGRGDGVFNRNPDGSVSLAPGYTSGVASVEDTKQGAKIEMVKQANGKMIPMRLRDAVQPTPTPETLPPAAPNDRPTFEFSGQTPQQILAQASTITDPAKRDAFITQLQSASPQDLNPVAWDSMPKLAQPTGVGQSTYQEQLQKGAGETAGKLAAKFGDQADAANNRIALNNQALDLVNKATTGPMASRLADIKNWLVSRFGISEDRFENTPSATQALQKDLVNAATQKAKQQFGSRITQSEVQLMLTRGSPSVDMTKAALQYLLQSDNASANYQIQQANDFGKYMNQGGDPYRFESWYASKFPMTNQLSGVHLQTGGKASNSPVKLPTLSEIDAEIARRKGK